MLDRRSFLIAAATVASAQSADRDDSPERYVKLVLAVGLHDPDYVDAYYGPPKWKQDVADRKPKLDVIHHDAAALLDQFASEPSTTDELLSLRHQYLTVQTRSLTRRVEILQGKRLSFDQESKALYDAVVPAMEDSTFEGPLKELGTLIPGKGELASRYADWQKRFFVRPDKLPAVFDSAITAARERTKKHITLPEGESFVVEYVKGQVWSAYNWYKGNAHSLIQVNTDLPVDVGFAIHLACHEGYPGHHVYNTLLEDRLVRQRGWQEFTVYPLYSPQSLIAEGSADYGVDLAFPTEERTAFLEAVLFPAAGLEKSQVHEYQRIRDLVSKLSYARIQNGRAYLDGHIGREECEQRLMRYGLMTPDFAAKQVKFIDKNRSYIINYTYGRDLIAKYMNRIGAPLSNQAKAWTEFEKLLSSPRLPSGLG